MCSMLNLCTIFNIVLVDLLASDVNAVEVHYGKIFSKYQNICTCNTINSITACIHQPGAYLCIFIWP